MLALYKYILILCLHRHVQLVLYVTYLYPDCRKNASHCVKFTHSTYRLEFFCEIFLEKKIIKIFCSEILAEMLFGLSTFKIICDTPPSIFHSRWLALLL